MGKLVWIRTFLTRRGREREFRARKRRIERSREALKEVNRIKREFAQKFARS